MSAYRQGHFYTCSEIAEAFIAGAREGRTYREKATDVLIARSADAYVKSVHPVATVPRTLHDRAREAIRICGGDPNDFELLDLMARHVGHMRAEHEFDESRRLALSSLASELADA